MMEHFPDEGLFEEVDTGINFHIEDIEFELKNRTQLESWINLIVQNAGATIKNITYIFCSDEYLYKINLEHLAHDTYTDIITFQYGDNQSLESDIFISIERVKDNADALHQHPEQELRRVIIHGILHLLGQKDKTPEQAVEMRRKEEAALALYDPTFS